MNQALLARQSWHILTHLSFNLTRSSQVLFLFACCLNVKANCHPSWDQKSLLYGKDMLVKGICWGQGMGSLFVYMVKGLEGPVIKSYPSCW